MKKENRIGKKFECPVCKSNFIANGWNQKYCSNKCSYFAAKFPKRGNLLPSDIIRRDGFRCYYCDEYYSANKEWLNMTLDHIIPKSKNGKDTASNLVACCFSCNASKRDKLKNDYVNTLKYTRLNSIKFGIDPDAIVDFTW
ncbi:MAG: HNH endonuclease [Candidatus Pacebacteria bacterium]|nr:HNH endonuclease [Candidatus Paceibacterota bacterium]